MASEQVNQSKTVEAVINNRSKNSMTEGQSVEGSYRPAICEVNVPK